MLALEINLAMIIQFALQEHSGLSRDVNGKGPVVRHRPSFLIPVAAGERMSIINDVKKTI